MYNFFCGAVETVAVEDIAQTVRYKYSYSGLPDWCPLSMNPWCWINPDPNKLFVS